MVGYSVTTILPTKTNEVMRQPAHGVDLYRSRMFGVGNNDATISTVLCPSDVDRVSAVVCIE